MLADGTEAFVVDLVEVEHVKKILWEDLSKVNNLFLGEKGIGWRGRGGKFTIIKTAEIICAMIAEEKFSPLTTLFMAFVRTMIPSPRIISVRRPQRSLRLVRLKLTSRHCDELRKTTTASSTAIAYHPIYGRPELLDLKVNNSPKDMRAPMAKVTIWMRIGVMAFLWPLIQKSTEPY